MEEQGSPRKRPFLVAALLNAGWLTSAQLMGHVLSFVFFVVVSRDYGPSGIGRYAYAAAIGALAYVVINFGIDEYGVREFSRARESDRSDLLTRLVSTQALAAALYLVGLAVFLLVARPAPRTTVTILLLTLQQTLLALARGYFVPAFAEERMRTPALLDILLRGSGTVVALALITLLHTSLNAALVAFPAAALLLLVAAMGVAGRSVGSISIVFRWRVGVATMRAAWPFGAGDLAFLVYSRADVIMLTLFIGELAAGVYSAGLKFVEVSVLPLGFLGFAAYPTLSRVVGAGDDDGFRHTATRLLAGELVAAGILTWFVVFLVAPALMPLLGSGFRESAGVTRILSGLVLLVAVETTSLRLLLVTGQEMRMVRLLFLGGGANILMNLVLIPRYGITGAIVASLITLFGIDIAYLRAVRPPTVARAVRDTLARFAVPVLGAGAVTAIAWTAGLGEWVAAVLSLGAFVAAAALSGFGKLLSNRTEPTTRADVAVVE